MSPTIALKSTFAVIVLWTASALAQPTTDELRASYSNRFSALIEDARPAVLSFNEDIDSAAARHSFLVPEQCEAARKLVAKFKELTTVQIEAEVRLHIPQSELQPRYELLNKLESSYEVVESFCDPRIDLDTLTIFLTLQARESKERLMLFKDLASTAKF